MQTLIQAIQHYQPYNEQEENDRRVMLKLLETQPDISLGIESESYQDTDDLS